MKKLLAKLNSRSGASILLALLLFLVCALAGAAAITASASNVGRYSYLEGDQQQYLSAASAAKLIRAQLDGLKAEGVFEAATVKDDYSYIDFPREIPTQRDSICTSSEMEYFKADYTKPAVEFFRKQADATPEDKKIDEPEKDIVGFFKDDLEKAVNSAFYAYVTNAYYAHKDIWDKASLNADDYKGTNFGEYELSLTCEGLDYKNDSGDDIPVNVTVKISTSEEAAGGGTPTSDTFKDGDTLNVDITVSCGETEFKITGEIAIKVSADETSEPVTRDYIMKDTGEEADPLAPNILPPIPVTNTMVTKSTITSSATFEIDSVISRVRDEKEGVSP